jgi:hypothetical protein
MVFKTTKYDGDIYFWISIHCCKGSYRDDSRYKYNLYMMGIHSYGSTNMFHDNDAVVRNSTMPESTLKKKLVAVSYCCVQEACALGMIQITKEDGATYLADLLTKGLPGPQLRDSIGQIIY